MDRAIYEHMADNAARHWWYVARRDIIDAFIARTAALPEEAAILELGAGTGHNLDMLARHGRVTGAELDEAARDVCYDQSGRRLVDARLPGLEGLNEQYDMVALLDVLEHVEEDSAALAGIRRVLKPGGKLLLTVPAYQWLWSQHDTAHHHFRRYTRARLIKLAAKQGYHCRAASYFNTMLFPLVATARFAEKLGRDPGKDVDLPAMPLNRALQNVFGIERHLVGRLPLPFGVSIIAMFEIGKAS